MPIDALLIDAGTGNLHSVHNALLHLGYSILVTKDWRDLATSRKIILPGVGAFGRFMTGLNESGIVEPLKAAVERGDPMLGICVGMQALFDFSEEMGRHEGLGLMPGKVVRFPEFDDLKVPHTGWNQLWGRKESQIMKGINEGTYAYFNHSYYCFPDHEEHIAASTDYGINITSIVQNDNVFGVQFHPEKSQKVGLQMLMNFMQL
jgi:imidazole glycerol-phosphate synthase subunit HisH